jgi:DNA helicase HerA-like ATPase
MMRSDATQIGVVREVLGAQVTVAIDPRLAGVAPIWEGRLQPVGQVGALVRIPQGIVELVASVALVGIREGGDEVGDGIAVGERWMKVQLLGELDAGGKFQRGVSSYPALEDSVHFATASQLRAVFPLPDDDHVRLGAVAASPTVPVALNMRRLVTRHCAIVGSTGSGKSSTVAGLLQKIAAGWGRANVVIIDPHGEYAPALRTDAKVLSVLESDERLLRVPYWALPARELLGALAGTTTKTAEQRFTELVIEGRRAFASDAEWLDLEESAITADSPVPFDLRAVWFEMDFENNATYPALKGQGEACVSTPGDAETLRKTVFKPYSPGSVAPYKGPNYDDFGPTPDRIRRTLSDSAMRFFQEPRGDTAGSDPLVAVVEAWLGDEKPVSVLDFSGVSSLVADLAIGVVLELLFELTTRSTDGGIGRARPILVVLEEAHRYLGDSESVGRARRAAERIAREGRKHGIGLALVTQRPTELPDTALAQVGTLIALRLTNGADQQRVKAAMPESTAGMADALASLRTGEALVSGEAVVLPTRVVVDRPAPEPDAADATLDAWRGEQAKNDLAETIRAWRAALAKGG